MVTFKVPKSIEGDTTLTITGDTTGTVVMLDVTETKKPKSNNGNGVGNAFAYGHDKEHVFAPYLPLGG